MRRANYLFTSESVSEGHPDKVCDQISDAVLDAFIENDLKLGIADQSAVNTRLGCETLCTTNKIVIAGEGRGKAPLFHKHGAKAKKGRGSGRGEPAFSGIDVDDIRAVRDLAARLGVDKLRDLVDVLH